MANLSANQTAVNNTNIVNRSFSCKTPQCFKPINDTVYKNHNHSSKKFSYEHCNMNKFTILHQNIQEISNKTDELLNSLSPNAPQVICLTEHHLRTEEIRNVNFSHRTLIFQLFEPHVSGSQVSGRLSCSGGFQSIEQAHCDRIRSVARYPFRVPLVC